MDVPEGIYLSVRKRSDTNKYLKFLYTESLEKMESAEFAREEIDAGWEWEVEVDGMVVFGRSKDET